MNHPLRRSYGLSGASFNPLIVASMNESAAAGRLKNSQLGAVLGTANGADSVSAPKPGAAEKFFVSAG